MDKKDISYITREFVRKECGIFGAVFSDKDCDEVITEVTRLAERDEFYHTGVYWIANQLVSQGRIHPNRPT